MPRKTLKQRRNPTDDNENRVRGVIDSFVGVETADDIMKSLIGVLSESGKIPTAGKYYTFFYNAKTPGIQYDEYPLVGVTDVFSWGFRGINFHWGDRRQYNYDQIAGQLYEIYPEEISDVIELAFANIRSK
jgi:hypothetical protein